MQVNLGHWVVTSFLFIGGRKPTYVSFLFIRGRKPAYVGFLLESTRKGHLIPGAVVFSILSFFPLENPCPSDNQRGARVLRVHKCRPPVGVSYVDLLLVSAMILVLRYKRESMSK